MDDGEEVRRGPSGAAFIRKTDDIPPRQAIRLDRSVLDREYFGFKAQILDSAVQARLITLVIQNPPGDLQGISDELHVVRSLSVEEVGVGKVLSV